MCFWVVFLQSEWYVNKQSWGFLVCKQLYYMYIYIYVYIAFKTTCCSPLKMCFLKPQPYHLEKTEKTHNLQQCHPTRKGHKNKETGQVPQTGWSENGGFEPPLEAFPMTKAIKRYQVAYQLFPHLVLCLFNHWFFQRSLVIIDHHSSSFVISDHQQPEQCNIKGEILR